MNPSLRRFPDPYGGMTDAQRDRYFADLLAARREEEARYNAEKEQRRIELCAELGIPPYPPTLPSTTRP